MPESLEIKQLKAIMRAEFRAQQTLERLRWEESVLEPAIKQYKKQYMVPGNEAIFNIDWGIVNDSGKGKQQTR